MRVGKLPLGVVMPIEETFDSPDIFFASQLSVGVVGEGRERRNPFAVLGVDGKSSIALGNSPAFLRELAKSIGIAADQIEEMQRKEGGGRG